MKRSSISLTGNEMLEIKRAASKQGWLIESATLGDGSGRAVIKDLGPSTHGEKLEFRAKTEEEAVVLSMAHVYGDWLQALQGPIGGE